MGEAAAAARPYFLLKLKLNGEGDVERVTQVRRARPDADLIADANQAWSHPQLLEFLPRLALGVRLIEQPLPPEKMTCFPASTADPAVRRRIVPDLGIPCPPYSAGTSTLTSNWIKRAVSPQPWRSRGRPRPRA